MKTEPFLALLLTLGASACSSMKQPAVAGVPSTRTPDQAVGLAPGDNGSVRTGESVKTYHLGRSTGAGGRTMHEAHQVYRVEKAPRWNLARNQPPLRAVGPAEKVADPAFHPAPTSQAIRAELNKQKEITDSLEKARDELVGTLASARTRLDLAFPRAEEIARLRGVASPLPAEVTLGEKTGEHHPGAAPDGDRSHSTDALRKWGEKIDSTNGTDVK